MLGGSNIDVTNVIFNKGWEDGWKHASILEVPNGRSYEVAEADCTDCSHCVDLRTEDDDDDQNLRDVRKQV